MSRHEHDAAKQVLGHRGAKLHTHTVHLERTANKGYIATHQMRDRKGRPPADGQDSERKFALANQAAMLAHLQQHMGDIEPDDGQESPDPADGAPQPPEPGQ